MVEFQSRLLLTKGLRVWTALTAGATVRPNGFVSILQANLGWSFTSTAVLFEGVFPMHKNSVRWLRDEDIRRYIKVYCFPLLLLKCATVVSYCSCMLGLKYAKSINMCLEEAIIHSKYRDILLLSSW